MAPHTPIDTFGRRHYDQEILDLRSQLQDVKTQNEELSDQNIELKAQNIEMDHKIDKLTDNVDKLTKSVIGLVEAWNTAKGITSFVKWLSGVILSCGIIWALFKEQLK